MVLCQIVITNPARTNYATGLIGRWRLSLISLTHDDSNAYNTYQHNIELRSDRLRIMYGTNRNIVYSTKQKTNCYIIEPFHVVCESLDGFIDIEVFDLTTGADLINLYSIVLTFDCEQITDNLNHNIRQDP
jgi:hypothetical protein